MTIDLGSSMVRRPLVGLAVLALLAGACSSDANDGGRSGPAVSTTSTAAPTGGFEEDPTFVEAPCWWAVPPDLPEDLTITCGTIDVPADRTDPASSLISLAVARLHRASAPADAPPTVNLHGGPGGSSLVSAPTVGRIAPEALGERDLILYDQRGSGRSTPSLNCPEKERATLDALGKPGDWATEFGATEEAVKACRARLVGEGIDLADYNTPNSVEDLQSIRLAFGIDTWNVTGRSYGTRLGLAYARAHSNRIRSLLLDSVYPPEVSDPTRNLALPTQAFDRLSDACDAEPACLAANGHVTDQLAKAVADFDARPETITGTITVDGVDSTQSFTLDGGDLRGGLYSALYDSNLVAQLPSIIAGLASGDRSIVSAFLTTGVPSLLDISEGAYYSFECEDSGRTYGAEGFERMREDPGDDALYAFGTAEPFCAAWDVPPVDASFGQTVVADVPTLVFGGTLDPITPFTESEDQAAAMPNARFVAVPGGGHGVADHDNCTRAARDKFWRDPSAELPACVADLTIAEFLP